MSDINTSTMLQVGTVLHGTYRIESYLSSGGFGNTYIAKNIEFGETYAVKEFFVKGVCQRDCDSTTISVSNSENTDSFAQQKEKFKKEARRLRSLNNPHIVKVYDLFEENGTAYYVMDYVDGESLSTRLTRTNTPLTESVVLNYLSQILDGLDAIHAAGIWHLDIKPANIMVDRHDVVKLIDFGASKQQSAAGGATASTGISYTNGYAPSEQMAQSFDKFGPWTDFYALGATLYKLLTNQNPPSVTDLSEDESEDKHLALPMANISNEMKKLVVWMMQVNRLKRPKNVGEIRNSANQTVSNITSELEECTIAINKTNNQCKDENGDAWKRDARRIYDEVSLKYANLKQADEKTWERLYNESEKRFIKKCRFFTFPFGILYGVGCFLSLLEKEDKEDGFAIVCVSVFLFLVFALLIGYGLPLLVNWFTLKYFVFHDVERKIKKNYRLIEVYKMQKKNNQTSQKDERLIVKSMYVYLPIILLVSWKYEMYLLMSDTSLGMLFCSFFIWFFSTSTIAYGAGIITYLIVKFINYVATQAKETFG